jgi:hypothetical protein
MTTKTARTPDWLVERIALSELPPAELERARAQLLSEPDGADRLAKLEASNLETLRAHPPALVEAEIDRRTRRPTAPRSLRWVPVALALPALAAAATVVVMRPPSQVEDGDRVKGLAPALELFRKRGAQSEELRSGARTRPGDVLQLRYQRAGRTHGLIVSLDGAGAVTWHLVDRGHSALLQGSAAVALDAAYELDAAPGFERYFFITSATGFDAAPVLQAARALAQDPARARSAKLTLPSGLEQASFLVEKESP